VIIVTLPPRRCPRCDRVLSVVDLEVCAVCRSVVDLEVCAVCRAEEDRRG
jgi:rRNA maturation endonuclease Nob1